MPDRMTSDDNDDIFRIHNVKHFLAVDVLALDIARSNSRLGQDLHKWRVNRQVQ